MRRLPKKGETLFDIKLTILLNTDVSKIKENIVIKNKLLVNISGNNSLVQRKLFNVFLFKIFNDLKDTKKPFFTIHINEVNELMGYKNNNSTTQFRRDCNGLMRTFISWGVLGDDSYSSEWEDSALLANVKFKKGQVRFEMPMGLRLRLVENSQYIKLNLAIQKKFTSKYSLIIYEFCKEFYREKEEVGQTRWIDLVDFKKLLGLHDNDNKEFKTFKRDILNLAIKEINKFSDILINTEFERESHKITAIKFKITKNPLYSDDKLKSLEFAEQSTPIQPTSELKVPQPTIKPFYTDPSKPPQPKKPKYSNITEEDSWYKPKLAAKPPNPKLPKAPKPIMEQNKASFGQELETVEISAELSQKGSVYDLKDVLLTKWLNQYGEEYILEKLELLDEGVKAGKINSPKGFLITAIQQGWEGSQKQLQRSKEQQELEERKKNPQTYRMIPQDYPDEESFIIEEEKLINLFYKPSWTSSDMKEANVRWYG